MNKYTLEQSINAISNSKGDLLEFFDINSENSDESVFSMDTPRKIKWKVGDVVSAKDMYTGEKFLVKIHNITITDSDAHNRMIDIDFSYA